VQPLRRIFARAALALVTALALVEASFAQPSPAASPTGNLGKVTTDLGSDDNATAMAIQPDGKLLVAGSTATETGGDFALVRYTADGFPDPSFGKGGMVTTDFGGVEGAAAVAVLSDGTIVVAGTTAKDVGKIDMKSAFALARYTPKGSLDPNFGTGGKTITDWGLGEVGPGTLALQADGKIVVVGTAASKGDFALARYTKTGLLDPSFGKGGKVTTDLGSDDNGTAIAIQPDGKIVVVGDSFPHSDGVHLALARYTINGSLDRGFGNGGKVTTRPSPVYTRGMAILSDGKIIVAGSTGAPFIATFAPGDFVVARYTTTGLLDHSFGRAGRSTANFGGNDAGSALAVQPDGKIVVGGIGGVADDFALARFTPEGSLDRTFGTKGKVKTDFGFSIDWGRDVAIQPDGKIVMAGSTSVEEGDFALARFTARGSLDSSFGMSEASPSSSPSEGTSGTGPRHHASLWRRGAFLGSVIGFALLLVVSVFVLLLIQRRKEKLAQ
jgi:uncharacterized delta-60 repeat protein